MTYFFIKKYGAENMKKYLSNKETYVFSWFFCMLNKKIGLFALSPQERTNI